MTELKKNPKNSRLFLNVPPHPLISQKRLSISCVDGGGRKENVKDGIHEINKKGFGWFDFKMINER